MYENTGPIVNNTTLINLKICEEGISHIKCSYQHKIGERDGIVYRKVLICSE
jgi:hypothetical protein